MSSNSHVSPGNLSGFRVKSVLCGVGKRTYTACHSFPSPTHSLCLKFRFFVSFCPIQLKQCFLIILLLNHKGRRCLERRQRERLFVWKFPNYISSCSPISFLFLFSLLLLVSPLAPPLNTSS